MRFFGRSLLLVILATLIAVAGFAQDATVPLPLHPNSRTFLSDTALIVMANDQPETLNTIKQAVESADGHVIIYAPPGILIVQIGDEGVSAVAAAANVSIITKTTFDPAAFDITDQNALLAVGYFNWVVSGQADATMDRPLDASTEESLQNDVPASPETAGAQATALASGDHLTLGVNVLVNLVYLTGGPSVWNSFDRTSAYNNAVAGMSWWNSRVLQQFGVARPSALPFFTIQTYSFTINSSPAEYNNAKTWANAAMSAACNGCTWFDSAAEGRGDAQTNVRTWNILTRSGVASDSFTSFLADCPITIGGQPVGGVVQFLGGAWSWIGSQVLYSAETFAHETGHVYWACDEYYNASLGVNPPCTGCGGPRNASNANSDGTDPNGCVIPEHRHSCIMKAGSGAFGVLNNDVDSEYLKVCPFTRVQIGWWSENSCYTDVNWNVPGRGTTHWEGTYWSDSHAPRMPLVHWSGGPQLTRDDGSGNTLDFNFVTNPLTGVCITGSSTGTRSTDFSARWRRMVNFAFGTYQFHGTGDDSVQIYVDGYQLQPSATAGTFENIQLNAGYHTVQVDYFQTSGNATVHVDWTQVGNPSCGTLFYGQLKPYQNTTDYCTGDPNIPHLQAFAVGGAAPYHFSIQRNNDVPVTYTFSTSVADIYPFATMGDNTYKLVSVVDANGCQGQVDSSANTVKTNIDSTTPRVNGKVYAVQSNSSCSVTLTWDPATDCSGGPISYTVGRFYTLPDGSGFGQGYACQQTTTFTDNDAHPGTTYTYSVIAWRGTNCYPPVSPYRQYPNQPVVPVSCTANASAIATSSITATYGDQPTLTAHLTGNGAGLPNRTVEFGLNGTPVGTGLTDANGTATAAAMITLAAGTYTGGLQVRFAGDDAWYASTAAADVTVQPTCTPATITSQPAAQTINLGSSATLSIGVTGTAPVLVKWYTTAGAFVGGSNSFTVTPSWTTAYYAMVSNDCHTVQSYPVTITVRQPATITWPAPAPIVYGTALSATQLNATADAAGTFTYTPAAGTVLAAGTQTLSLSFSPTDTAHYLVTTATRSITVQKATPAVTWSTPAAITYGTALSATQLNATASVAGTFSYTPAAGTVLGAGSPTLSVTFTPTDTTTYNSVTTTRTIVVNKANPTGSWPAPEPITYGTPLSATQLNGTADIPGTIVYNPPAGTILTAGTHTLTATFTPNDTANYNVVSGTVSLTVLKATQTITWATPSAITYGTALSATQLNATASVAGTFSYSPAAGTVLGAGSPTLSVTFTPTDTTNYNSVTTTRTIVVNKANPTGSWSAPASITYGTPLSATQLNGTADIPGTIVYNPPAGTILTAGTHTLTATFTPNDTANYNVLSGTVSITVLKAAQTITWATPAQITNATPLSSTQLNATVSVVGPAAAGAITYDVASGTVLSAGDHTITATAAATANYDSAQRSVVLHVCGLPTITWQPTTANVADGNSTTLSIEVSSSTTAHYQWYDGTTDTNGAPVGTDSATFNTGVLTNGGGPFSMLYRYWVVITNDCGQIRSGNIDVIVSTGGNMDDGG